MIRKFCTGLGVEAGVVGVPAGRICCLTVIGVLGAIALTLGVPATAPVTVVLGRTEIVVAGNCTVFPVP